MIPRSLVPLFLGLWFALAAFPRAFAAAPDADMRLLATAHMGDVAGARAALAKGANPNVSSRGYFALNLAAQRGHLEVVKLLLQNRADPNRRNTSDYDTYSALEQAVFHKDKATVDVLLKAGANPNLPRAHGRGERPAGKEPSEALLMAIRRDQRDIARTLLESGARAEQTPDESEPVLHQLAVRGWTEEAALAIRNGADINGEDGEKSWTPLIHAAREGHLELVQMLLAKGAKLDATPETRGIESVAAAAQGHWVIARLLRSKAMPALPAALWFAAGSGDLDLVRKLLEDGTRVDAPDPYLEWTPLMWAADSGHAEVGSLLLSKGANATFHVKDQSPLLLAAGGGHAGFVTLLLKQKADPNEPLGDSCPLQAAARKGNRETVAILLAGGARTEVRSGVIPPLVEASFQGHLEVVRLLLEKGASLNATLIRKDSRGDALPPDDALSMAAEGGKTNVMRALIAAGARLDGTYGSRDWTPQGEKSRPLLLHSIAQDQEAVARTLVTAGIDLEGQHEDYITEEDTKPSEIESALTLASSAGLTNLVRDLLAREIHAKNPLRRYFFREAMLKAARAGHAGILESLERVAPAEASAIRMNLAVAAIQGGHAPIMELQVARGAVPDEPDAEGNSLIVGAAEALEPGVLAVLLRGSDPTDKRRPTGRRLDQLNRALIEAVPYLGSSKTGDWAEFDRLETVRLLLDAGANPNTRIGDTSPPLYRAGPDVTSLLLGAGADPNTRLANGETPLHRALLDNHWYRAEILVENGAQVNVPLPYAIGTYAQLEAEATGRDDGNQPNKSDKRATPLHIAAAECAHRFAKLLLQKGANPNARDAAGRTPLKVAGCDEVKTLLRGAGGRE